MLALHYLPHVKPLLVCEKQRPRRQYRGETIARNLSKAAIWRGLARLLASSLRCSPLPCAPVQLRQPTGPCAVRKTPHARPECAPLPLEANPGETRRIEFSLFPRLSSDPRVDARARTWSKKSTRRRSWSESQLLRALRRERNLLRGRPA